MEFIFDILQKDKALSPLFEKKDGAVAVSGTAQVHKANIISSLCHLENVRAFCVASDETEAQGIVSDICAMGKKAYFYPAKDLFFGDISGKSREYEHERLSVLSKMKDGEADVVVSCIDALSQYTIPKEVLEKTSVTIRKGDNYDISKLSKSLSLLGYERTDAVEGKGQFALRGGIFDFFRPEDEYPVRIEFWGDEVIEIANFELESQRRFQTLPFISFSPSKEILVEDNFALSEKIERKAQRLRSKNSEKAKEILQKEADEIRTGVEFTGMDKYISLVYETPETILDYLDKDSVIFISEHNKVCERVKDMAFRYKEDMVEYFASGTLCRGLDKFSIGYDEFLLKCKDHKTVFLDSFAGGSYDLPLTDIISLNTKTLPLWNGSVENFCEDIDSADIKKGNFVILGGTIKASKNLADTLNRRGYNAVFAESIKNPKKGLIYVMPGALSSGFEYTNLKFTLISYGKNEIKKSTKIRRNKNSQEIYSLSELSKGDYVVHRTHGIGIFDGIR
ncbi:MAG: CarD family transcriptional regulator, partial [Acutalibacteraceae bacterium]